MRRSVPAHAESLDNPSSRGNEKYVRAVVRASNGDDAWTQPAFRR